MDLDITFRRDPTNFRPRINKKGSVKDREQKEAGTYFLVEDITSALKEKHAAGIADAEKAKAEEEKLAAKAAKEAKEGKDESKKGGKKGK